MALDSFHLTDQTLQSGAFAQIKSMKAYDLKFSPEQHLIDTFAAIGWTDPLPRVITQTKEKFVEKQVTPEQMKEYRTFTRNYNKKVFDEDNYVFETVKPKALVY